ncbi:MAG: hypothetical protein J7K23_01170, partial [Thermoproteales archaeon]|nr:hypothetical protein [Thermoproteales archaeon]
MHEYKSRFINFCRMIVNIKKPYSFSDFIKVLVLPILTVSLVSGIYITLFYERNIILSLTMYFVLFLTVSGLALINKWTLRSIGIDKK